MNEILFGEDRPFSSREFQWLGDWAPWLEISVWVLVALTLLLTVYNYRRLRPRWRAGLLVTLRVLAIGTVVGVFYQPAFLEETVAKSRNHVAVLVDASESMGLPHGELTRIERAGAFFQTNVGLFGSLEADSTLSFHQFGTSVREIPDPREGETRLQAVDPETNLIEALRTIERRADASELAGVIVVTDGLDTGTGDNGALSPVDRAVVESLGAPVHLFVPMGAGRLKDVAIERVSSSSFAFAMNATSLEATVRVDGYSRGELAVTLRQDGAEVGRRTVSIRPGERRYPVSFEWVPKELGKRVISVEVENLADEVYGENNRRDLLINVIRDKVRVLQIVGQPSWDQRFLRNHLKQDPNVDLISFFILVNPYGPTPDKRETALIPFPSRELFEDELDGFDLVIFQNFNYGPFDTRKYLPRVRNYVLKGGAFVMVGGPLSFSAGQYYGTPITEVLPVDIPPDTATARYGGSGADVVYAATIDTTPFRASLTPAGEFHPVTRLALEPGANQARWRQLQELEGINKVQRLKQGSLALVTHPTLKAQDGTAAPVVAVRELRKGRTMAVMTDSTWHWGFKAGNEGQDARLYDAFWSNAVRWLIKDPELDLIRVRSKQESVRVGAQATVRVDVFGPDYRPAAEQPLTVIVRRRRPRDGVGSGEEVLREEMKTDAAGTLTLSVPVLQAGVYEVEASAKLVAGRDTRGLDLFIGTKRKLEFDRVVSDGRWETEVAAASDGAVHDMEALTPTLKVRPPQVSKVTHRRVKELWNTPFAVLMLALMLGIEWWLRRRWGYL